MNSSFSTENTNLQLAWDSTSLGALKTCPRSYEYAIIRGLTKHSENVHLLFGQHYHACLEAYDYARAIGKDHEDAVRLTVQKALVDTWDAKLKRPWNSDDKNKNRVTLVRTLIWYLEQFKDDPVKTVILASGKPAVELSFRFESSYKSRLTGKTFLLCGHLDRMGVFQDQTYIIDRKSTKSAIDGQDFFDRYSPDNQMSLYELAGGVVYGLPIRGVMIDAAQILITGSRFRRGFTYRTQQQRDEWYKDLEYWLAQAELFAEKGYWPQNDKACGLYGGCPFRPLCGKSPSVRGEWEKEYKTRIWDPLVVRGDI
jgi:hypothetical protein